MSYITDIVLHLGTNAYDQEAIRQLHGFTWPSNSGNAYSFKDSPPTVVDLGDHHRTYGAPQVGGYKVFTMKFLAGSYNYLDLDALVTHLRQMKWRYPKEWVLVADVESLDSVSLFWQDGEKRGEMNP